MTTSPINLSPITEREKIRQEQQRKQNDVNAIVSAVRLIQTQQGLSYEQAYRLIKHNPEQWPAILGERPKDMSGPTPGEHIY